MLSFSCSHRPGVCITRPNCKARSDGGEGRGPSWLVANEAFSLKSASVRWAGWATVTYGRVGKLKTRVGKRKKNSALSAEFLPTLAWNPAGALDLPCLLQQQYGDYPSNINNGGRRPSKAKPQDLDFPFSLFFIGPSSRECQFDCLSVTLSR